LRWGDSKENLVVLTAKEHFICHLLLTKMVAGNARHKMVYAFHGLKAKQPGQNRYSSNLVNAKLYQQLKEELSIIKKGKIPWNKGMKGTGNFVTDNPMKNPESIKKMLETRRINKEKKSRG
jgi:hypothetical protein